MRWSKRSKFKYFGSWA